jgi:hypothetical protein
MRSILSFLLFLILNFSFGQAIPSDIKKVVGFIYEKVNDTTYNPLGTGFFVSVEKKDSLSVTSAVYFVTAKHVIKSNDSFRDNIYLRLNKKDSLSKYIPAKLFYKETNKNVFFHSEKDVDIAVISIIPNPKRFDFLTFPSNLLTNEVKIKELNISEGTDIFFTGLFVQFTGEKRIYPIMRFGRVALITEEKIPWKDEFLNLYLFESTSYGGNSGSPVFFYLGAERGGGGLTVGPPQLLLAGVMKGHFNEGNPIEVVETKKVPFSVDNNGIAAVVPSYYLEEILFSNELKRLRGF